jgi:hypothetical protein
MILIGSGALLWHAAQQGVETPLPENSMDVDPITASKEVALLAYESMSGSQLEKTHGWHVNSSNHRFLYLSLWSDFRVHLRRSVG